MNMASKIGQSGVTVAAGKGFQRLVKYLLEKGANVNQQDESGYTALMDAAYNNYVEVVKVLLEHGADVNMKTKEGYSAHHYASLDGNVATLTLLEEVVDFNIHDDADANGITPLMNALGKNKTDVIKHLVEDLKVDVNKPNLNGT